MLKILRSSNGQVIFTLIGRMQAERVAELEELLKSEAGARQIVLDLKDLTLADRDWSFQSASRVAHATNGTRFLSEIKFGYAVFGFTAVVQAQDSTCPDQARIGAHDLVPFSLRKSRKRGRVGDASSASMERIGRHRNA